MCGPAKTKQCQCPPKDNQLQFAERTQSHARGFHAARRKAFVADGAFRLGVRETHKIAGEVELRVMGEAGELLCRANPLRAVPAETPLVQFWGDLHGQS